MLVTMPEIGCYLRLALLEPEEDVLTEDTTDKGDVQEVRPLRELHNIMFGDQKSKKMATCGKVACRLHRGEPDHQKDTRSSPCRPPSVFVLFFVIFLRTLCSYPSEIGFFYYINVY
jgi:hypothetical protein